MIDYMIGKLLKMGVHISMIIIAIFTIPTACSPDTAWGGNAFLVDPSGNVNYHSDNHIFSSYGIYSLSGHVLQRRRMVRVLVWPCRLQRRLQPCRLFLRVYTISPVMNYGDDVGLVGPSGGIISSGYGLGIVSNSYG